MTICEEQKGGRILCLRLSGLGDIVHALNALALLRQQRPEAYIAWAVEERFSALLNEHPHLDEVIAVPRSIWLSMMKSPIRWPALGSALRDFASGLRERRFDVSVDFQSSLKSTWLVKAAGASLRAAFDRPVNRELNLAVQNCLVKVPTRGIHRIERDLALLAPLGIPTRYADAVLPVSEADRKAMEEALAPRSGAGPLVVIHPGTSKAAAFKRWEPDRYAQVADALVTERGADVVVTHGPEDRGMAEELIAQMRHPVAMAPRTYNLQQLAYLLSRADLFIGSDTGPMHMASALKVPVVALFGPKDAVQTGPYCSPSIVVTGLATCRPCTRRTCAHVRCMTSIRPDRVLKAALEVLDGKGRRRAQEGPIKKPFTVAFQLGDWRGGITTCYSAPEFYMRLCDPEALISSGEAKQLEVASADKVASVPGNVAGLAERLVVRQYARYKRPVGKPWLRRAKPQNAWDCALAMPVGTVPFPVCYMERRRGRRKQQLLIAEEVTDSVPLRQWLSSGMPANEGRLPPAERNRLVDSVARAVGLFHRAAYCHGDLSDTNILIRPEEGAREPRAYIAGLERARRVSYLPPGLREVLYAFDLAGLALSATVPVCGPEAKRFFETYCLGLIRSAPRRRLLARLVMRFVRRGQRCHR